MTKNNLHFLLLPLRALRLTQGPPFDAIQGPPKATITRWLRLSKPRDSGSFIAEVVPAEGLSKPLGKPDGIYSVEGSALFHWVNSYGEKPKKANLELKAKINFDIFSFLKSGGLA